MKQFEPDYRQVAAAAWNKPPSRLPLYEHLVSSAKIGEIIGRSIAPLYRGDAADVGEFFAHYCGFFRDNGYDIVPFEECIGAVMPGAGALGNSRMTPVIQTAQDFARYPWGEIPERYFARNARYFEILREKLPSGMKAVGGVGNGVFECVQELTGFENLCYIAADDPELYTALFEKVADTIVAIWKLFLEKYQDIYCVLRFGDDLGYKSATLLTPDDIRRRIIPQYRRVTDLVHACGKPFLLHSCGCIFDVMEDLIDVANIDAKHSNEDQIAGFPEWALRYGDRLGNFGGIDTDAVCRLDKAQMREYILDVLRQCEGRGGFAFGSGNSIPDYVPAENYLNMIEIVREARGDYTH